MRPAKAQTPHLKMNSVGGDTGEAHEMPDAGHFTFLMYRSAARDFGSPEEWNHNSAQ